MKKWYAIYTNILYLYFSEGFYKLPENAKNAISPTQLWKRLFRIAGYTLIRLIGNLFKKVEHADKLKGKVWLYVVSQNNYDSLKFIQEAIPNAVFVAGQKKEIGKYNYAVNRLSLKKKALYYYKFFPLLLKFLTDKPKITKRFFDVLFDAVGFYEVYLYKLQKYKPACVVFSNDHNADARAMLLAAKNLNIKTVYIQHASVSTIFPPLQFDLNLLEGQDSLDKYKQCGPIEGEVQLVGMPKSDQYVQHRKYGNQINTIGIAFNLADNTAEIEALLTQLVQDFPSINFILRPHPRDTRNFDFIQKVSFSVSISNSRITATFDFLKEIDVLISGNSGIHLEAVLLNVWSIFYQMNKKEQFDDYYGFVKNGLVDAAASYAALEQLLQVNLNNKPEVYLRAKYYNATIGTAYDGKSRQLAEKYIRDFIR